MLIDEQKNTPKMTWKGWFTSLFLCIIISLMAPSPESINGEEVVIMMILGVAIAGSFLYVFYIIFVQFFYYYYINKRWVVTSVYLIWFVTLSFFLISLNQFSESLDRIENAGSVMSSYVIQLELAGISLATPGILKAFQEKLQTTELTDIEQEMALDMLEEFISPKSSLKEQNKFSANDSTNLKIIFKILATSFITISIGIILIVLKSVLKSRTQATVKAKRSKEFENLNYQIALPIPGRTIWETVTALVSKSAYYLVILIFVGILILLVTIIETVEYRGVGAVSLSVSSELAFFISLFLVGFYCVWALAEGRKSTVLFLRKFGDRDANDLVKNVASKLLSSKARLVVLDDSSFGAVTLLWKDRFKNTLYVVPFLILLFIFSSKLSITVGPNKTPYVTEAKENLFTGAIGKMNVVSNAESNDTVFLEGNPFLDMPYGLYLWAWLLLICSPILIFMVTTLRGKIYLSNLHDIHRIIRLIRWSQSWFSAPRIMAPLMTLASTKNTVWKETVVSLLKYTDLVIIDITSNSEALQWEVVTSLTLYPEKCIFIANRSRWKAIKTLSLVAEFGIEPVFYDSAEDYAGLSLLLSKHSNLSTVQMFNSRFQKTENALVKRSNG